MRKSRDESNFGGLSGSSIMVDSPNISPQLDEVFHEESRESVRGEHPLVLGSGDPRRLVRRKKR